MFSPFTIHRSPYFTAVHPVAAVFTFHREENAIVVRSDSTRHVHRTVRCTVAMSIQLHFEDITGSLCGCTTREMIYR